MNQALTCRDSTVRDSVATQYSTILATESRSTAALITGYSLNTIADNTTQLNPAHGNDLHWYAPMRLNMSYEGADSKGFPGNYFDTYSGVDADGDGFGDTPFVQDFISDPHPLMALPAAYYTGVWYLGMGNTMYHNNPGIEGGVLQMEPV